MNVSDLSYLESINELTPIFGAAGTAVMGTAEAYGDSTYTSIETTSWARETSPDGGSVSVGQITAVGIGDDAATTDTSGTADGEIIQVVTVNEPMANAPINYSRSHTIAVGVDPPQ